MKRGSDKYARVLLSTDSKPIGAFAGQLLIETDTGDTFEWTGASWQQTGIGGAARIGAVIDFVADIEVDGIPLTPKVADKADSGDTTAVVVAAGDRAKLYGVSISPQDTLTGDVHIELGSTQVTLKTRNAIVGGAHWILPLSSNFIHGALGEDIVISNTVAEAISYAIYYEVYTP